MFILLLVITFLIAFLVSFIIVKLFRKSIDRILNRIIADEIASAWTRYLVFEIYVTGISAGVGIRSLEKYITPSDAEGAQILTLTLDRWVLEIYGTIIGSLQGVAWMLLVFFIFALIAFVIVKIFELKKASQDRSQK